MPDPKFVPGIMYSAITQHQAVRLVSVKLKPIAMVDDYNRNLAIRRYGLASTSIPTGSFGPELSDRLKWLVYRPEDQAAAQRLISILQRYPLSAGPRPAQYHREMGEALGFTPPETEAFIRHYFGPEEQLPAPARYTPPATPPGEFTFGPRPSQVKEERTLVQLEDILSTGEMQKEANRLGGAMISSMPSEYSALFAFPQQRQASNFALLARLKGYMVSTGGPRILPAEIISRDIDRIRRVFSQNPASKILGHF